MYTDQKSHKERLEAAYTLLTQPTTSIEKFEKIRTLVKGIHPSLDASLAACGKEIKKIKGLSNGDVIELTADALPEVTEEQKKRKKYILLFITSWKSLKSEVKRVKELQASENQTTQHAGHHQMGALGKMLVFAKGPFGLITAAAVVIVGAGSFLQSHAVMISIKNQGCSPLSAVVKLPVPIPGLSLPTDTIADGGTGTAKIPPLTVTVDGTNPGSFTVSIFGVPMNYSIPAGVNIIFDGSPLIGRQTTLSLGEKKEHTLIVQCR